MLRVRNEAGAKEFTYKLLVYSLPHLRNPSNAKMVVKVLESNSFTCDCDVDAVPPPEVCVIELAYYHYTISFFVC